MNFNQRILLVALFAIMTTFAVNAQVYNSAIGLRVGYPLSITYKKNTSEKRAFEIFGGIRPYSNYNELRINGAIQIHQSLSDSGHFRWYYGAGAGLATYTFSSNKPSDSGVSLTASGYLGLEFTFDELPINLTLDWVPTLYIGGYGSGFGAGYGALAVRYVL